MKKRPECSFCGRGESEITGKLVEGQESKSNIKSYICEECLKDCTALLYQDDLSPSPHANPSPAADLFAPPGPPPLRDSDTSSRKSTNSRGKKLGVLLPPKDIKQELDAYVIGQEQAKKVLSVAVYNHYKRLAHVEAQQPGVEIAKSNVLLLGPSGSGKTLLAQTLARLLDVPFAVSDATTLTEAGYVGEDVESVLANLLQRAGGDAKRAQRGIVYIDEIDKISRKSEHVSITRDVSGEGVQQGLLKLIEGTVAAVPPQGGRKHPEGQHVKIDTSHILFICGGAFEGLDKIVSARTAQSGGMGFFGEVKSTATAPSLSQVMSQLNPEDLVRFGLIPELIGRLPVVTALDELDQDALIRVLTEPRNSLVRQYQTLFRMDGIELEFEPDALLAVAQKAKLQKTGARGLRSILENALLELMFDIPGTTGIHKVVVHRGVIDDKQPPHLINASSAEAPRAVAP